MAVVSNNPEAEVVAITENSGILPLFDLVVGNDGKGRAKKPAPDSYVFAAQTLAVPISECAVIEDLVLGLNAGRAAGAYTIGVASGAESFAHLAASQLADVCHTAFTECRCTAIGDGPSTVSSPEAPIDILIELILESCGKALRIVWNNNNWPVLAMYMDRCIRCSPGA